MGAVDVVGADDFALDGGDVVEGVGDEAALAGMRGATVGVNGDIDCGSCGSAHGHAGCRQSEGDEQREESGRPCTHFG